MPGCAGCRSRIFHLFSLLISFVVSVKLPITQSVLTVIVFQLFALYGDMVAQVIFIPYGDYFFVNA